MRTGIAKTKGTTVAKGTVQFVTTSQVSIRGTIDDVCPQDGYGAYLRVRYIYRSGPLAEGIVTDRRKCKPGPQAFSLLSTSSRGGASSGCSSSSRSATTTPTRARWATSRR